MTLELASLTVALILLRPFNTGCSFVMLAIAQKLTMIMDGTINITTSFDDDVLVIISFPIVK